MLGFSGLALGENGWVFNQPKLIPGFCCALIGEIGHGLPAADVVLSAEIDYIQSLRQFTSPF